MQNGLTSRRSGWLFKDFPAFEGDRPERGRSGWRTALGILGAVAAGVIVGLALGLAIAATGGLAVVVIAAKIGVKAATAAKAVNAVAIGAGVGAGLRTASAGLPAALNEEGFGASFNESMVVGDGYLRAAFWISLPSSIYSAGLLLQGGIRAFNSLFASGGRQLATRSANGMNIVNSGGRAASAVLTPAQAEALIRDWVLTGSLLYAITGNGGGSGNMVGQNGTQTSSTTTGRNGRTERIDVENPNPGQRPGQIHYHEPNGTKWMYDINSGRFVDAAENLAPPRIQRVLNEPWAQRAIERALQYLGL